MFYDKFAKPDYKSGDDDSAELDRLLQNYDAAQCLPSSISPVFLSAALMHMIDNKVEFAMVRTNNKIYIGFYGGDEQHIPHRWSDKKWRIGLDLDEDENDLWDHVS